LQGVCFANFNDGEVVFSFGKLQELDNARGALVQSFNVLDLPENEKKYLKNILARLGGPQGTTQCLFLD
jgi:hypothetical protein